MRIVHVVGARPNFMKVGPVIHALDRFESVCQVLVHTGQHYDANMSDIFFRQLGLPEPDVNLGIGSASHAVQTAQIMAAFEAVLLDRRPDWVVVYGDVNSTVAAALVSTKLHIKVAHVEAGLRSFDRTMPEEINRVITDQIADLLFTPSKDGNENLHREGVDVQKIHLVGNVMIDTLVRLLPQSEARWQNNVGALLPSGVDRNRYVLVTLHRPSNVDDPETLRGTVDALIRISAQAPILFPVHPRTRHLLTATLEETAARTGCAGTIHLLDPLSYLDFLALQRHAALVITDSGGVQEETSFLGTPCLTARPNTERPITVDRGTNRLVGRDPERLYSEATRILSGEKKKGSQLPLWDGKAGERIAAVLTAQESRSQ